MEYLRAHNIRLALVLFSLFFWMTTSLLGQGATNFFKTYTGGLFDFGQGITQLDNGKYAVTGSTSSLGDNSSKAFLMVIDEEGNQEWTKGYGGSNSDWGRRVFHETGEGFWIAGYSNSFGDQTFDFTLLKIDETGALEWEQNYGTSDRERLWDAIRLDDGSFVLVGETEGVLSQGKDVLAMRIDSDGTLMWEYQLENAGDDIGYATTIFDNTTILVAGDYYNNGQTSGIILKMNIDGSVIEQWVYDEEGPASFRDVKRFGGQTYVCGSANSTSLDYVNSLLLRLDDDYTVVNKELADKGGDYYVTAIALLANDRLYCSFKTNSEFLNIFPGGWDSFILRYHRAIYFIGPGFPLSAFNDDEVTQIISTTDGGIIAIGSTSDDRSNLSNGSDVMIAKIGPNDEFISDADEGVDLVSTNNLNIPENRMLYPNPTDGVVTLSESLKYKDISVLNILGEKQKNVVVKNYKVDLTKLPTGMYFIVVEDAGQSFSYKIVKK